MSSSRKIRQVTPASLAANHANAQKSTGPRTEEGKMRASQNARKLSIRLLGLAEARTLNQEPAAADKLYRELIAPFEPAPALLAFHFEDLARLRLELEAWERIRDAQLEHRWQQIDLERRRLLHEMETDLQGTTEEVFKGGLCRLPESAAKFKQQVDYLGLLKGSLSRRDFDIAATLHFLFGQDLNPPSDRAQAICMGCEKLMKEETRASVSDEDFVALLRLVDDEERDALDAYVIRLDEKTLTRPARLARLGPNQEDHWMNRQGERLRQAVDRKQWVITGLLQALGLGYRPEPSGGSGGASEGRKTPLPPGRKSRKQSRNVH